MKTDYAMVVRCFSCYDHIFRETKDFIRLYNSKRKYFTVYNQEESMYDTCFPGDVVEFTEEFSPMIIKNLDHEKRLAKFNARYKQLQKQR